MFTNVFYMRQIEILSGLLTKAFFHKDNREIDVLDERGNISASGLLYYRLKILIRERKINEAENLLFDVLEEEPTEDHFKVAIHFYQDLHELDEATLRECDFTCQEVIDGLDAVRAIYQPLTEVSTNSDTSVT